MVEKYYTTILSALGLILLLAGIASAGPSDTLWTRTYGGSGLEIARSVQQTEDGGFIIAGWTTSYGAGGEDCYIVRTDAAGDTLWTGVYGSIYNDRLYHIEITSDGGYIAVGYREAYHSPGQTNQDICMIKTDADGDTLWTRTYGGEGDEEGRCILQTGDGGYILCGQTGSFGAGEGDVWVLKTDTHGDTLWTRTYGGNKPELAFTIIENSDSGYAIAGFTYGDYPENRDGYVIVIDEDGDTLWTRAFGSECWDEIYTIIQTDDGGYLCSGGRQLTSRDSCLQATIMKIDAGGRVVWERNYGQDYLNEYFMSVSRAGDGGFILGGTSGIEDWSHRVTGNVYTVKTDSEGYILWSRIYGVNRGEQARAALQTQDGGYIVAAKSYGMGPDSSCDFWLLKLAGDLQEPEISVDVVPDNPPIITPAGQSFTFSVNIDNNTDTVQTVDMWFMLEIPEGGFYGPVLEYEDIPIPAGTRVSFQHVVQEIPESTQPGLYNYITWIGDYPVSILTSSMFEFEVIEPNSVDPGSAHLPNKTALYPNWPNPFNNSTKIEFYLANPGMVDLSIYNLLGQKVCTLIDGPLSRGGHAAYWSADKYGSGVYIYKLRADDKIISRKMELLK
jgi:hypothetical protein